MNRRACCTGIKSRRLLWHNMAAKAATVSSAIRASRHGAVSFSSESIARVRDVLQTVGEDLLAMEAPQPVDPLEQTPDGILRTYETLLAHGFEVGDIEAGLQVPSAPAQCLSVAAAICSQLASYKTDALFGAQSYGGRASVSHAYGVVQGLAIRRGRVSTSDALDWLCFHLDHSRLPVKFSAGAQGAGGDGVKVVVRADPDAAASHRWVHLVRICLWFESASVTEHFVTCNARHVLPLM